MARRRLASGLLAMVTACAAGAACSAFSSEGSTPFPSEGGAETSLADGPVTPDTDAADGGSSPDARSCPTVLDEPFDAATFSGSGWVVDSSDGGTLTHDPNLFGVSAPSLHATAVVTPGGPSHAELTRDYHITSSGLGTVTLSFSMLVQPPNGGKTYAELGCGLFFRNGTAETISILSLYANQDLVTLISDPNGGPAPIPTYLFEPALQGWYDVTLTVSSVSTAATVDIVVANDAGSKKGASLQAVLPANLDTMHLACGVHFANLEIGEPASTMTVRVDDIHLTRCLPP
jgi:hypothetical protein